MLQSYNRDVFNLSLGSFSLEVIVDLTAAYDDLLDLVVRYEVLRNLSNDSLESEANLKLFYFRSGSSEFQKLFRDRHDQWLSEGPSNLSPKQVEVLSGSRAIAQTEVHALDNPSLSHIVCGYLIISIIELKETLDSARRMLGAGTVVAVRQKHDQARLDVPL